MTSKCYSVASPGGLVEKNLMTILSKCNVVGYVPLEAGSFFDINPTLFLHAKQAPTILVNMPKQIPSDTGKRNVVLKELSMTKEAMERIQRPDIILPKPLDKTMELISTVHSIHFQDILV